MTKTYSELQRLSTYSERFDYLKLHGDVGARTFGPERYLNQQFYMSREWRSVRRAVIIRDSGCDLGIEGLEIPKGLYIHHLNPMTVEDLIHRNDANLDPEFLITVSFDTHNAIHYGRNKQLSELPPERKPGDTKLW